MSLSLLFPNHLASGVVGEDTETRRANELIHLSSARTTHSEPCGSGLNFHRGTNPLQILLPCGFSVWSPTSLGKVRTYFCSLLAEGQLVALTGQGVSFESLKPLLLHLCLKIPFLPTKRSSEYPIVIVQLTTLLRDLMAKSDLFFSWHVSRRTPTLISITDLSHWKPGASVSQKPLSP